MYLVMGQALLPQVGPLAFFGGSIPGFGKARNSPAWKLRQQLRPMTFSWSDFRKTHVRAVDLDKEIKQQAKSLGHAGRWKKDRARSEPMDEVYDDGQIFGTNIKAGGILDVVERYPWTGEAVKHARRDKRRGQHTAYVTREEDGPCIVCTWDDPYGGDCTDTFQLSECGNVLTQISKMTIRSSGRSTQYKTVYQRLHH